MLLRRTGAARISALVRRHLGSWSAGKASVTRGHLMLVSALVASAAIAPFVFSPAGDVMNNLVLAATYVGMALGLNIIVGYAGLLDLGYVAFFAIGAYTAGYLGSGFWQNAGRHGQGLSFL